MADAPRESGDGRVTVAVLSTQLQEIDRKLVILMSDHDSLVRMQVRVEQNTTDIGRLAKKSSDRDQASRDRDKARRRESLAEMVLAAVIGASSWIRPV
jgi:hypothetical protein